MNSEGAFLYYYLFFILFSLFFNFRFSKIGISETSSGKQ